MSAYWNAATGLTGVVAPITNTGTQINPVIGISAATTGSDGSMSAADKLKLDGYGTARNMLTLGGNVALNNVGYTTILSGVVSGGGNQTIAADVSAQSTSASNQTFRLRIRINGVDVGGVYDYIIANGFIATHIEVQAVLFNGDTVAVVGLVGTGNVSALRDMPDGAGVRATRLMWGV